MVTRRDGRHYATPLSFTADMLRENGREGAFYEACGSCSVPCGEQQRRVSDSAQQVDKLKSTPAIGGRRTNPYQPKSSSASVTARPATRLPALGPLGAGD
jgi:hypothetical protein